MASDVNLVKMGTCTMTFKGNDLGFTKGGVSLTYETETTEKTVDQLDTPIDEVIMKQSFEAKIPLAERDLDTLATLLPGTTLVGTGASARLEMTGAAGGGLSAQGGELVLTPADGDANGTVKFFKAIPIPSLSFAFEKENQLVYEVTFRAIPDDSGNWVHLGDPAA